MCGTEKLSVDQSFLPQANQSALIHRAVFVHVGNHLRL